MCLLDSGRNCVYSVTRVTCVRACVRVRVYVRAPAYAARRRRVCGCTRVSVCPCVRVRGRAGIAIDVHRLAGHDPSCDLGRPRGDPPRRRRRRRDASGRAAARILGGCFFLVSAKKRNFFHSPPRGGASAHARAPSRTTLCVSSCAQRKI